MCLILAAIDQHPDYPLIIAANRDEFYARPSRPLSWWPEDAQLLGGRDLESGGSWFGLTRAGHLAAVTNYREAGTKLPQRPSRGILVRDYLQQTTGWGDWLKSRAQEFNGFNLLYGKWNQLNWFSNRGGATTRLETGIYGLCNSLLDTPWPKVERGKRLLQQRLGQQNFTPEDLLQILQDDLPAAHDKLPDTGIGQEWEHLLSPIFICSETYGTRASTILLIDRQQQANILERNWRPNGSFKDRQIEFDIPR
jgi:uncharacterized protein with NRDE domain